MLAEPTGTVTDMDERSEQIDPSRMSASLRVFWDERLTSYDFGPEHPMNPVRVELTMALARELGVFDAPGVSVEKFEPAGDALLELVHDSAYIDAVRREQIDVDIRYAAARNCSTIHYPVGAERAPGVGALLATCLLSLMITNSSGAPRHPGTARCDRVGRS